MRAHFVRIDGNGARTSWAAAVMALLAGLGCGSSSTGDAADASNGAADGAGGDAMGNGSDAATGADGTSPVDGGRPASDAGGRDAAEGEVGTDGAGPADSGEVVGDATARDGGEREAGGATKIVGGYYPNWTPSPPRIRDVDPHYNVIYLFAATPAGDGGTGAVEWTPPGDGLGAATNLVADIAYARTTQGRKILLSVGGAGNDVAFPNRGVSQTFLASFMAIVTQLGGIDGIDWDNYEGSDSPDTNEMIWISQQLKGMVPGFLVTSPPAPWSTVDQTFCSQMQAAGALDYCAPQYYDGPNLATQAYIVPSVDTWSALLGETSLVVGFGIANATNYMTVAQVISTWQAADQNHPNLRGAFDWQIDVDDSTGWPFATQVGPLIDP